MFRVCRLVRLQCGLKVNTAFFLSLQIQSGRFTFQVERWYKGSSRSSMIAVMHTWTEGDPCRAGAFPDRASDFLVFASGGSVETCRHSFPWSCVPASFKRSLPIRC
ncbi:hypothetical protein ElyMa_002878100 [Elysia marginata]|uniref:Secreted protein n=1 Tax=Elysia marginata TaxID=1093978 RepID=A0AAV4HXM0_9GAST|nr:hypothetical protein ElyMa_002878100 [Elysia marginata]